MNKSDYKCAHIIERGGLSWSKVGQKLFKISTIAWKHNFIRRFWETGDISVCQGQFYGQIALPLPLVCFREGLVILSRWCRTTNCSFPTSDSFRTPPWCWSFKGEQGTQESSCPDVFELIEEKRRCCPLVTMLIRSQSHCSKTCSCIFFLN